MTAFFLQGQIGGMQLVIHEGANTEADLPKLYCSFFFLCSPDFAEVPVMVPQGDGKMKAFDVIPLTTYFQSSCDPRR